MAPTTVNGEFNDCISKKINFVFFCTGTFLFVNFKAKSGTQGFNIVAYMLEHFGRRW